MDALLPICNNMRMSFMANELSHRKSSCSAVCHTNGIAPGEAAGSFFAKFLLCELEELGGRIALLDGSGTA
jgi:hypothetical protein